LQINMIEKKDNENNISRLDFLKKLWIATWWAIILATWWKLLYNLTENKKDKKKEEKIEEIKINSIKDKPINLWYKKIVEDKDIDFINSRWNKFSTLSRISRCLRRKPVTDAVEDRYNIPRWLLMAMMAQEWMWDPTMPNLWWDWWLGLIHIQAVNAHDFGLKTLQTFTNWMRDTKHGKLITDTLNTCNNDIPELINYDDRRHPIMAVDCAARFLVDCKRRAGWWTDDWIHALSKYSWREYSKIIRNRKKENIQLWYWLLVIKYRSIINDITWDSFPDNFSKNINQDIENAKKSNQSIKKDLNNLEFGIDWKTVWYEEYLAYFEESMQNFELERYVAIGKYKINKTNKEDTPKEVSDKRWEKTKNTLIKSEFVNTGQHNSEWFLLYRYVVKKWDTIRGISNRFNERDKKNWDKYGKTWILNIVKRNWKEAKDIKEWDVVYIKTNKI